MPCTHALAMVKLIRDIFDVRGIDFDNMHFDKHPTRDLHFNANSISTYVRCSDGYDYCIEVRPVRGRPLPQTPAVQSDDSDRYTYPIEEGSA